MDMDPVSVFYKRSFEVSETEVEEYVGAMKRSKQSPTNDVDDGGKRIKMGNVGNAGDVNFSVAEVVIDPPREQP